MELNWTHEAISDLARLYAFLAPANKPAAALAVQALSQAPTILLTNPYVGEQLFQFEPREIQRILVRQYEIRYSCLSGTTRVTMYEHNLAIGPSSRDFSVEFDDIE
ncbi:MAG: type II toxin-antitoxin system RelE/ParE family toxin [Salinisphaera sp.]|jgi:plasmid stabilization system protein ParE|nr:type II toxin-antitoxin system RelE/ParE family toxin [Salinisphaera sp.]